MANVKSQFTLLHSVFIPFEHSTGEQPTPFESEVENVVQTADTILGDSGYFTSSFENPKSGITFYMIGFKRPSEGGGRRKAERLFDLYFGEVGDLEGKDLRAIITRLRDFPGRARTPDQNVGNVTVDVMQPPDARGQTRGRAAEGGTRERPEATPDRQTDGQPQHRTEGERRDGDGSGEPGKEFRDSILEDDDRTPGNDSEAWSPPRSQSADRITIPPVSETTSQLNVETITHVWEAYRQANRGANPRPIRMTLRELSYFAAEVSGSLPEFKVLEDTTGDVRHFNVVVGERSRESGYEKLARLLQDRQHLSWDALPWYRDEVEEYRNRRKSKLRENATYAAEVDEVLDEFKDDLEAVVEEHVDHAVALYVNQLENGGADDGGMLGDVRSRFSRGENDAIQRITNETNPERVSQKEEEKIAKKMMNQIRDDVQETAETVVESKLESRLNALIDRKAEAMAKEVVAEVDSVRQHPAYDEGQ